MAAKPTRVCVTGANGFVATQIIKDLLLKGIEVVGTVRSLAKTSGYQHLKGFTNAEKNLILREADIESEESLKQAFQGCSGVLHTASPFFYPPSDQAEELLVKPAVNGATCALKAAISLGIKRVVLTSSVAAMNGTQRQKNPNHVITEDWNDTTTYSYAYSKTAAEKAAWEVAKTAPDLQLVVINPPFILGPVYSKEQTSSTSVSYLIKFFDGSLKDGVGQNPFSGFVDVRVVAQAHINALLKPEAKGRYVVGNTSQQSDIQVAQILAKHFPKYNIPTKLKEGEVEKVLLAVSLNHSKAEKELGLTFLEFEKTIVDMATSLIEIGLVQKKE